MIGPDPWTGSGDCLDVFQQCFGWKSKLDDWFFVLCLIRCLRVVEAVPEGVPLSGKAGAERKQQCWIVSHAAFSILNPLRYFSSGLMPSVWCLRVLYLRKNTDSP